MYLDLNHYIHLAQAAKDPSQSPMTPQRRAEYAELATAADRARTEGRAIFPLSGIHMLELSKVKDPRQRVDVATVMEELSGFTYLLGRITLSELEVETSESTNSR